MRGPGLDIGARNNDLLGKGPMGWIAENLEGWRGNLAPFVPVKAGINHDFTLWRKIAHLLANGHHDSCSVGAQHNRWLIRTSPPAGPQIAMIECCSLDLDHHFIWPWIPCGNFRYAYSFDPLSLVDNG